MKLPKLDLFLYVCNRIVARVPSHTLRLLFYRKIMGFDIAAASYIFMDAWFDAEINFTMGPHSVINQRCRLDNRGGIIIGTNVSISAEVTILTADHDPQSSSFDGRLRPVIIGDRVFIGTRALILPGVTLGEGCVVAAGSVVTKDVNAYSIVAGVPAKEIGSRNSELDYIISYGRPFF